MGRGAPEVRTVIVRLAKENAADHSAQGTGEEVRSEMAHHHVPARVMARRRKERKAKTVPHGTVKSVHPNNVGDIALLLSHSPQPERLPIKPGRTVPRPQLQHQFYVPLILGHGDVERDQLPVMRADQFI